MTDFTELVTTFQFQLDKLFDEVNEMEMSVEQRIRREQLEKVKTAWLNSLMETNT